MASFQVSSQRATTPRQRGSTPTPTPRQAFQRVTLQYSLDTSLGLGGYYIVVYWKDNLTKGNLDYLLQYSIEKSNDSKNTGVSTRETPRLKTAHS